MALFALPALSAHAQTSGVTALSSGWAHTCAVINGGVQCWGWNEFGQLGIDSTLNLSTTLPVEAIVSNSGVTDVSSGQHHTCAVVDGGVKCWGSNFSGQLGDGTNTNSDVPVPVTGIPAGSGATAVSAGADHSCAVVSGGVQCWGANVSGQLGDVSNTSSNLPVPAIAPASGATKVSSAGDHTCALVSGGVQCWGYNTNGQLGNGTTSPSGSNVPVTAIAASSNVSAIAAGRYHSCAVFNGGIKCWGWNLFGQIGLPTSTPYYPSPYQILAQGSGATDISAGNYHTCAVVNGGVQCWGYNTNGQLGNNTTTDTHSRVSALAASSGATAAAAGGDHSCAIVNSTNIKCWGSHGSGELGDGRDPILYPISTVPVDVSLVDTSPDAFTFPAQTNVAFSTVAVSNTITLAGLGVAVPLSITGGEYSLDGGAYTSASTTVNNGQTLTLRLTSSASFSTTVTATLAVGGYSTSFAVTTLHDTPDVFSFTAQTGIALSTPVSSNSIVISGLTSGSAPISITGGQYSLDGVTYTSSPGTVNNTDTVTVRLTSSASYTTTTSATLTVGSVSASFSVTTVDDTTPAVFYFPTITDAALSSVISSSTITVSDINVTVPISITGGEYSLDGVTYTSSPGTVNNTDTVTVRLTSSASYYTTVSATLTIGSLSADFFVTTLHDTTPNAFTFTARRNARPGILVTSNPITVAGITTGVPISIVGGTYSLNGGAYISVAGTVNAGDTVRVQRNAAMRGLISATLTIGGVNGIFRIRTRFDGRDFQIDGKSDILWRNSITGANVIWKSASSTTPQAVTTQADLAWKIAGTGDFDGDGYADILWRNSTTGANIIWKRAISTTTQAVTARTDLNWKVAGIGDFNGDGKADILWRHGTTGANAIWKSASSATSQAVAARTDLNWNVAGIGDFNGDGKSDILWRHSTTGANAIWKSASSSTQQAVTAQADLNWQVAGVGDFNNDGRADILWRNTSTGENVIWKSASSAATQAVAATATTWQVAGTGDYNYDSKADILWRNTSTSTGNNVIWKSAISTTTQAVTAQAIAWQVQ